MMLLLNEMRYIYMFLYRLHMVEHTVVMVVATLILKYLLPCRRVLLLMLLILLHILLRYLMLSNGFSFYFLI